MQGRGLPILLPVAFMKQFILFAFIAVHLTACGVYQAFDPCPHRFQSGECYQPPAQKIKDADLVQATQQAAHALSQALNTPLDKQKAMLVTRLANLNRLEESSALGRVLAEQLAAHFTQMGYTVREVRFRQDLFIQQDNGEFILSRSLSDIYTQQAVATVTTGTYAVGHTEVYVSLKVLDLSGVVLASHLLTLPLGKNVQHLLSSGV